MIADRQRSVYSNLRKMDNPADQLSRLQYSCGFLEGRCGVALVRKDTLTNKCHGRQVNDDGPKDDCLDARV